MVAESGIPILKADIQQRVSFAESMTMGQTIFEWAPKSSAAREITSLTTEIAALHEQELRSSAKAQAAHG